MADPYHFVPECSRCGYDQSGEVMTWEQSCPMTGVCPECGLTLRWADVFSGRHKYPAWSYEHARRGPVSGRAFVATVARCFMPWRLWRELKMHHPVARVRLGLVAAVGTAIAYAGTFALAVGAAWVWAYAVFGAPSARIAAKRLIDEPYTVYPPPWNFSHVLVDYAVDRWFVLTVWTVLAAPLVLLALKHTVRGANIRPANLARIWLYGLVPIPAVLGVGRAADYLLGAASGSPFGMGTSGPLPAWRAALEPLSEWVHRRYDWDALAVIAAVYVFVWLSLAYKRYLELPHALGVAAASVLLALLVGLAVMAIVMPGGLPGFM